MKRKAPGSDEPRGDTPPLNQERKLADDRYLVTAAKPEHQDVRPPKSPPPAQAC